MRTEYIPKFITLLAGAVVCIISIVKHMDTTYSLEILLATLLIFYVIGTIARKIIEKVMVSNRFIKEKAEVEESSEETQEESQEEQDQPEQKENE